MIRRFNLRKCLVAICCWLILGIHPLVAAKTQGGLWEATNYYGHFGDSSFLYSMNLETRYLFEPHPLKNLIIRPAVGYELNPSLAVYLGYGWFPTNTPLGLVFENRVWQQVTWRVWEKPHTTLFWRTRLEQRKLEGAPEWNNRLREQFTLMQTSFFKDRYQPIVFDEIFFNLNTPKWVNDDAVNENRFFAGVNIKLVGKSILRVGYMNRYNLRRVVKDTDAHIAYFELQVHG